MSHSGLAVFFAFFGLSLLDALWTGHWVRGAFWLAMGFAFWALDRTRGHRSRPSAEPNKPT